jgi:hypothetical protein
MIYFQIALMLIILLLQAGIYLKNRQKAHALEGFYPPRDLLSVFQKPVAPDHSSPAFTVDQLKGKRITGTFKTVLEDTNLYLLHTKGGAADFSLLKDLATRHYLLLEDAARARLNLPLYIGLLGAMLGLGTGILGVVPAGIVEAGIRTLMAGSVLALAAGFCGLLFTLLSRWEYRQAREQAVQKQQAYFSFLQVQLLPRLQQDMASSFNNLRSVLDQFNKDFFQKIIDFKEVFGNLSQYVSVQEKLLTALEKAGLTDITDANIRFLDKIRENASLFESFGHYQHKLNDSLQLGAEAARDIRMVVERLRQIDDVQAYIRQNEEMLRKQLGYLSVHQEKMENLSQGIQQHFIEAGDEMSKLVQKRMQILRQEEQDAGEALREHFERLKQENVYQKISEQLQPIAALREQMEELSSGNTENSRMLLETSEYLLKKINQDGRMHDSLLGEIKELNRQMSLLNEPKSWWQRMWGGK